MASNTNITPALGLDRGGVPHIEADMACKILDNIIISTPNSKKTFYFIGSYFDALSLLTPCRVTKRDALTEMGIRSSPILLSNKEQQQNNVVAKHVLVPRSPLYPCLSGLPTADVGPAQDLIQGRITMTVEKWKEVIDTTKPEMTVPLCELIAIQEVFPLNARKKQSLSSRNEKWMKETMAHSSCGAVEIILPLGTHFNFQSNNKQQQQQQNSTDDATTTTTTNENEDTASSSIATGVAINEALYLQWCDVFRQQQSSASERHLALLNLGAGETVEQRQKFLEDLANYLVAVENKATTSTTSLTVSDDGNSNATNSNSTQQQQQLPPLRLILGNVTDLAMVEQVESVFFSGAATKTLNWNRNIIVISSHVPMSFAEKGMALHPNSATQLQQQQETDNEGEENSSRRRDRNTDEGDNLLSKTQHQKNASSQSATPFDVINLWDPVFKFSKLPLYAARGDLNKEKVLKKNEDFAAQNNNNNNNNITETTKTPSRCPCYACERHTAGYFHHLLDVHEMNAEILLSVHNYTQWFQYLSRK